MEIALVSGEAAKRLCVTVKTLQRWEFEGRLVSAARTPGNRDVNAALNLERLVTGALAARQALPVASSAVTPGTAAGIGAAEGGEVTPAGHEHGQQDGSGQEEDAAHKCTLLC